MGEIFTYPDGLTSIIILLITNLVLINTIICEPTFIHKSCEGTANDTADAKFNSNLNSLLDSLSSKASLNTFYTNSSNGIYGLYLCRGDVSTYSCQVCVSNASQEIQQLCPSNKSAIIWYDQCTLRYSNQNFIGVGDTSPFLIMKNVQNYTNAPDYGAVGLIYNLIAEAPDTDMMFETGYSVIGSQQRYGLVQCTRDINSTQCSSCLGQLIDNINQCCKEKIGWRVLSPSCNLRYEVYLFYQQKSAAPPPIAPELGPTPPDAVPSTGTGGNNTTMIVVIVVSISSLAFIGALSGLCYYLRSQKRKRRQSGEETTEEIMLGNQRNSNQMHNMEEGMHITESDSSGEMHYYNLSTIRAATNNFSARNKLGEGGFGPVYKGELPNGKEMAVKRLSMTSRQGLEEFRNEVKLIAKLQHKNLVRLLGYCWEGDEKLLVYEYLANKSLDAFLFDPKRCEVLDWTKRANIVTGTARGLLYLHEDSRLKIIHRDLKASNILLDDDMNPKISDFGTARIFGGNQIEANTDRVVGTYGYMAPEYALEGLISMKSDVYSFGILMLEVISGKKNRGIYNPEHGESLLLHGWELWNEGKGNELIDPNIVTTCPINEALRWIHIALLCVQDDPALRPTMSQVVLMLGSKSVNLPELSRAPFSMNASIAVLSDTQTTGIGSSLATSDQSTSTSRNIVSSSHSK